MVELQALEFFSGIGAFAQATGKTGIRIAAAFDQSLHANRTYESNYRLRPLCKNLDTLKAKDVPSADVWWLSPPCKPFTVRGNGRDDADSRARCLSNLIDLLPAARPNLVLVENVLGFAHSRMHKHLVAALQSIGLQAHHIELCPTLFGIPMRRPRLFIAAARDEQWFAPQLLRKPESNMQPLRNFLQDDHNEMLDLDAQEFARYGDSLHIVDEADPEAVAICFTSGYGRCLKAAGTFLRNHQGQVRRFSPREELSLFGFADGFIFPDNVDLRSQWRLIGNSVDVRAIRHLLSACPAVFTAAR